MKNNQTGDVGSLFIMGMERSGTSLLRNMINAHPEIYFPRGKFILPMANKWKNGVNDKDALGDFMDDLYKTKFSLRSDYIDKMEMTKHLGKHIPAPYSEMVLMINRYCSEKMGKSHARYLGEKSPSYTFNFGRVKDSFDNYKVIHIIRDGRAVLSSILRIFKRKKRGFATDVFELAFKWKQIAATGHSFSGDQSYLEVKYEDLIGNTEANLQKICTFLDLEYNPIMAEYFNDKNIPSERLQYGDNKEGKVDGKRILELSAPQTNRMDAWKDEVPPHIVRIFDFINRSSLKSAGYDPLPKHLQKSALVVIWEMFIYKISKLICKIFIYKLKIKDNKIIAVFAKYASEIY